MTDNQSISWVNRLGKVADGLCLAVSPERALRRQAARMAYDALDGSRTRRKRVSTGGTADTHLTDTSLDGLREIQRDMMRNNPLVEGLLLLEQDELMGDVFPKVQALSSDESWNLEAEASWKEEAVDRPIDITGRFRFHDIMDLTYLSYRRDGDHFVLFLDDALQLIEGECVGTPYNLKPSSFMIVNGLAFSNLTGELLGYYVGSPRPGGYYIDSTSYKQYDASRVHMIFNPQRTSQSRGEPALKSSITKIDQLDKYVDAELVAANVQAAWTMFISVKDSGKIPTPYTFGNYSSGQDADGNKLEKLEPGKVWYGNAGEEPHPIGMTRPTAVFDNYVTRMLSFITAPLGVPVMMALGDYSGATFMNTRVAYQRAQDRWKKEQARRIVPLVSRIWRWHIDRMIARKVLKDVEDKYRHTVQCRRWPYVDPQTEAAAEDIKILNGTGLRREYIEARGGDYNEHLDQLEKEKADFADYNPEKEPTNAAQE